MPKARSSSASNTKMAAEVWATVGLAAVLAFFLLSGIIAYLNIQAVRQNNRLVLHTHEVLIAIDELLSTTQDAETGQRGYLLTGNERYLEPYTNAVGAVAAKLDAVTTLTRDNPSSRPI